MTAKMLEADVGVQQDGQWEITPEGTAFLVDSWRGQLMHDPERADIHFRLAQALERLEQFDDALEHYRTAVVLISGDARLLDDLDELSPNLADFEEVKNVLRSIYLNVRRQQAARELSSSGPT